MRLRGEGGWSLLEVMVSVALLLVATALVARGTGQGMELARHNDTREQLIASGDEALRRMAEDIRPAGPVAAGAPGPAEDLPYVFTDGAAQGLHARHAHPAAVHGAPSGTPAFGPTTEAVVWFPRIDTVQPSLDSAIGLLQLVVGIVSSFAAPLDLARAARADLERDPPDISGAIDKIEASITGVQQPIGGLLGSILQSLGLVDAVVQDLEATQAWLLGIASGRGALTIDRSVAVDFVLVTDGDGVNRLKRRVFEGTSTTPAQVTVLAEHVERMTVRTWRTDSTLARKQVVVSLHMRKPTREGPVTAVVQTSFRMRAGR